MNVPDGCIWSQLITFSLKFLMKEILSYISSFNLNFFNHKSLWE